MKNIFTLLFHVTLQKKQNENTTILEKNMCTYFRGLNFRGTVSVEDIEGDFPGLLPKSCLPFGLNDGQNIIHIYVLR